MSWAIRSIKLGVTFPCWCAIFTQWYRVNIIRKYILIHFRYSHTYKEFKHNGLILWQELFSA